MPVTIAVSGKGGVGKSTISALTIHWLNRQGIKSILAVDADSNVNLNELLGVQAGPSVGAVREEMKEKVNALPGGMSKQEFLEYKIHSGLVETESFDLITMGRPEGPGCYCYANSVLRDVFDTLSRNYEYMIIDNEAGMEHLSRRTVQQIDYLLIISDPTVRGIQTAGRISRLLHELDTRVGSKYLIINRVRSNLSAALQLQIKEEQLILLSLLPENDEIRELDSNGLPVTGLSEKSPLLNSIDEAMTRLTSKMLK
ncbi:hypothetical protein BVY01_01555 [bacterium I07]|nr:hypothetical protein BVY01_01555 [bacterium I07]